MTSPCMFSISSCTKYSLHLLLVGVFLWPGWQCFTETVTKQDVVLQIITQFRSSTEHLYDNAHLLTKETINHGREPMYAHLRERFEINSWLNFTSSATPDEILKLFCWGIFTKHVNAIAIIKHEVSTPASYNYIMQLAQHLGYPVISWDPDYPGALQSDEDSRVLQIAPTIYHQCQAMALLLTRYNWTAFSIVTSKISSHDDFISCMTDMVKKTSIRQGYSTKAKFTILSTVSIDISDYDDYEVKDAKIEASLETLIRTVTRVVLLHAGSTHAKDILEVAAKMELTGQKYIWLLTSNSIGGIIGTRPRASRAYPIGTLGISYNDTQEKIVETMTTSLRIWALGLEKLAQKPDILRQIKMYPSNSCNSTQQFWIHGERLYRAMRSSELTDPPVKFTENGIIEKVALQVYNVRPMPALGRRPSRRQTKTWAHVGNIVPVKVGKKHEMKVEMDEIVWPGHAVSPPRGKPEKRFFRIVTLEELPYIIYEPPAADTGKCRLHAVPCKLVKHNNKNLRGNYTVNKGMVNYCCTGLCVDLLEILSRRMNFAFEMYEVEDGQWGIEKDDGEWTGLIKEMLLKKADMVITSIKINQQRATAIDFSTPFLETGITIMVALRKGAISATAFLEPFDMYSWVLILLLSIPVVASAIFTTEWLSPIGLNMGSSLAEPYDYPSWCLILVFSVHATGASIFIFEWLSPSGLDKGKTSLREHKFSLFRSFWLIWAMLFGASVSTDNPRGMSSRFLANVWALFALVFLASYTANLAAFMITIDEYFDLSGIEDWRLMNPYAVTPHFRFATVPGGSTEDNLKKNYPRMHSYMQKYNKSGVEEGIVTLKRGEIHAFIYDATVLEYNAGRDKDCDLITVGKWYAMTGYGVGFPKGSPHIDEVNKILLELQNNGELERLQKFWLAGACHAQKDKKDKSSHNIGILNFTSAFILLAGGVLLGTILLLLEHCYFKFGRKCLKKYDKCGCCSLVSLSMGKSLTFEQSVIDAIDFHKRHRCKDPLCETQLWKARHELDLALLKIERLREELNSLEGVDDIDGKTILAVENNGKLTELNNGTSVSQVPEAEIDLDKEISDTAKKRHRYQNHIDPSDSQETILKDREFSDSNLKSAGPSNKFSGISTELSELDKRRLQFRRSPSYTNAMSTDSEGKEVNGLPKSQSLTSNKLEDFSPKRCPSYSQAVEHSSVIDQLDRTSESPKQNTRTRYYDGKYYVGVAGDNDESAL